MRFLGLLLTLFLSLTASATYLPGTAPALTVGGYTFSSCEMSHLKILYAHTGTSGRVSTPREAWGTAGYSPGSNFRILAVKCLSDVYSSATSIGCSVGYGDNDVGQNSAAAATNAKYLTGFNDNMRIAVNVPSDSTYLGAVVPSGKYLFHSALGNASSAVIYGVLTSDCP